MNIHHGQNRRLFIARIKDHCHCPFCLSFEHLCSFGVIVLSNHCTSQRKYRPTYRTRPNWAAKVCGRQWTMVRDGAFLDRRSHTMAGREIFSKLNGCAVAGCLMRHVRCMNTVHVFKVARNLDHSETMAPNNGHSTQAQYVYFFDFAY